MTKLVEELVISSDVLVDVLVQVGFLDKAFVDGNAYRIDCEYGRDRVNTYTIKVEKEVSLNSVNGDCESCAHTYEEKKEDAPQFVSPLEFAVNLIANLNEQASKDDEQAKKFATEFIKRVNKAKDSI